MPSQGNRRIGEPQLNLLLAQALDRRHPQWSVTAEQTRTIRGSPGLRPDIVIEHPGGQPLIIETEILPAPTVELDAASRLGVILEPGGDRVEHVVALRVPETLTYVVQRNLRTAIERTKYEYATLFLTSDGETVRWPTNGWLHGNVDDLANLCENVALSEHALAAGLATLEEAVQDVATHLRRTAPQGVLDQIAEKFRRDEGEKTARMAAAIILNATTFHTAIAGHHDIPTIDQLRDGSRRLRRQRMLDCWAGILRINYWPIFHIAAWILRRIPIPTADRMLEQASDAAARLAGIGVTTMHDLAGRMFQQLIADRKFLATFYTLPPSAAMIAELAAARLDTDWASDTSVTRLRVADLACGTGTLLSAAYQAIRSRHRRAAHGFTNRHTSSQRQSI